jgi:hypothetical protein
MVTKPLKFRGRELTLNFATSAAGSIRVELQGVDGIPIPNFSLADSDELFGDTLDRVVTWKEQSDLTSLAGRPLQIRMVIGDADVYSLQFREACSTGLSPRPN